MTFKTAVVNVNVGVLILGALALVTPVSDVSNGCSLQLIVEGQTSLAKTKSFPIGNISDASSSTRPT